MKTRKIDISKVGVNKKNDSQAVDKTEESNNLATNSDLDTTIDIFQEYLKDFNIEVITVQFF